MSLRAIVALIVLTFTLSSATRAMAGFSTGIVLTPANVQQGSGPGWLAEDTGSATVTTIPSPGGAVFGSETYFTGDTLGSGFIPGFADAGLNALFSDVRYTNPTMSANLPVSAGERYVLQLLFWEPLGYITGTRMMNISVTNGTTDTLTGFDVIATIGGTYSANKGAYVNYGFTAAGNSITLALTINNASGDPNVFVSGFSLLTPEPSSGFMLFGGGLALFRVIRRRR